MGALVERCSLLELNMISLILQTDLHPGLAMAVAADGLELSDNVTDHVTELEPGILSCQEHVNSNGVAIDYYDFCTRSMFSGRINPSSLNLMNLELSNNECESATETGNTYAVR
ncbi:hypothetical protein NC653_000593 [Populus alba x Populus x berolinensis]|uniref:Uncharacterized protein n=1 Tax=Populus alba x Populus x berolinensis TaxID=444605 RepID=A0AAD6RKT9_9ROSI|nr:hypothetical protein NC653_000593 [Populus alba x Populus x berolinensis]